MAEQIGDLEVALRANVAGWEAGLARATMVTTSFASRTMSPLINIAQMFRTVGVVMFGVGAAGAFAFSKMIGPAIEFQDQMAQVATMVDDTGRHMDDFAEGVTELSARFGEATASLTKGLYDILSAAIAPSEALSVLEVSARAAAAGMTDTGTAADAVTTMLNAFSLSADQAEDVADLLFAIVRRGKTTFDALAPSIGRVAASAALAGLSMEEMGATLATVTRAGIPTRIAVTSLNAVIRNFLTPTDEARAAAAKLGIELTTTTLRTKGLSGVIVELAGLQPELVGKMFPNVRALRAMAAVLQGATGYAYDYQFMLNRAGMMSEAFEKRINTLQFAINRLKQTGLALVRTIGEQLLPELKEIVNYLSAVIKAFLDLNSSVKRTIAWFLAAVPVIVGLTGAFLLLLGPLTKLGIFLLTTLIPAFVAFALTPVGLVVTLLALTAAIFGGISAFKAYRSLTDGIKKAMDELTGAGKKTKDSVVDIGDNVTTLISKYKALLDKTKTLGSGTEELKDVTGDLAEIAKRLGPEVMSLTNKFAEEQLSVDELNESLSIHFELIKQRTQYIETQRKIEAFNSILDRLRKRLVEVQTTPILEEGFWADVRRAFYEYAIALGRGFEYITEKVTGLELKWYETGALLKEDQEAIIAAIKDQIGNAEEYIEMLSKEREEISKKIALNEEEVLRIKELQRAQREFHDLLMEWLIDERTKKELNVEAYYKTLKEAGVEREDIEIAGVKTSVSLEEWRSMRLLEIRSKSAAALVKVESEFLDSAQEKRINVLYEEFKALEKYGVLRMDRRREIAAEILEYAKEQTEKLAELGAEHGRAEWRVLLDIIGYWVNWKDVVMTIVDDWRGFLEQQEEEIIEVYRKAASKRRAIEDSHFEYQMLIGEKTLREEIERLELQSKNVALSAEERDAILTKLFKRRQDLIKLENDLEQARFLLQKARGLTTLEDEIENQEKIVAKTKEGTVERIKEETTLAEMRATLAKERIAETEAWFEFYRKVGLRSIQDEISWREELLVAEGISQERRQELIEKLLDLKKDLAEEEKAIADSRLAYEKFIGEATLADEIETLQEELAAVEEFSKDYWEIKLLIAQKEKDLADERIALSEAWLKYQKALGEESLEDEIAILKKRLLEEKLSELEYADILTEIAVKESELKEIQKIYEEDLMTFRRLTGKETVENEIKFWEERLDAEKAGTSEYVRIDTTLYNLREQRRKEEEKDFESSLRASKEAMYAKAQLAIDYWNLMGHGREAEILETKVAQEKLLDAVTVTLQAETEGYKVTSQVYVKWREWAGDQATLIRQQTADKIVEIDKKYGKIEMGQAEERLDYAISVGSQTYKAKVDFLEWYLAGLREGTDEEKQLRTEILTLAEKLGGDELRIYDELAKRGHEVRRELIGVTIEYGDEELDVLKKLRDAIEEYVDFEISEVEELPAIWWKAGEARLEGTRKWLQENYEEHVYLEKKINAAVKEGTENYIEYIKEKLDQELELSELSQEQMLSALIAFYERQIAEAEKATEFDLENYRKLVYEKKSLEKELSDYRREIREQVFEYERLIGIKTLEDEIARVNERLDTEKMSIKERIRLLTLLFNLSKQLIEERERLAERQFDFERTLGLATLEEEVERQAELVRTYEETERDVADIIDKRIDLYESLKDREKELIEILVSRGRTNAEIEAEMRALWLAYYKELGISLEEFEAFFKTHWKEIAESTDLVTESMAESWARLMAEMRRETFDWYNFFKGLVDSVRDFFNDLIKGMLTGWREYYDKRRELDEQYQSDLEDIEKDYAERLADLQERRLDEVEDFNERVAELEKDKNERLEKLAKDYEKRLADLEKKREKRIKDFNKKVTDLEERRLKDLQKAREKYEEGVADAREDMLEEEEDYREDIEELEEKHLEKLKRLNKDYVEDAGDALDEMYDWRKIRLLEDAELYEAVNNLIRQLEEEYLGDLDEEETRLHDDRLKRLYEIRDETFVAIQEEKDAYVEASADRLEKHNETITALLERIVEFTEDYKASTTEINIDFEDVMKELRESHDEAMKDIADAIAELTAIYFERLKEIEENFEERMAELERRHAEAIKALEEDIADLKKDYEEKLQKALEDFEKQLAKINEEVDLMGKLWDAVKAKALDAIASIIATALLKWLGNVYEGTKKALEKIKEAKGKPVNALDVLLAVFQGVVGATGKALLAVENWIRGFLGLKPRAIEDIEEAAGEAEEALDEDSEAAEGAKEAIDEIDEGPVSEVEEAADKVTEAMDALMLQAITTVEEISKGFALLAKNINTNMGVGMKGAKESVSNAAKIIVAAITGAAESISLSFSTAAADISAAFSSAVDDVNTKLAEIPETISIAVEYFDTNYATIKSHYDYLVAKVISVIVNYLSSYYATIKSQFDYFFNKYIYVDVSFSSWGYSWVKNEYDSLRDKWVKVTVEYDPPEAQRLKVKGEYDYFVDKFAEVTVAYKTKGEELLTGFGNLVQKGGDALSNFVPRGLEIPREVLGAVEAPRVTVSVPTKPAVVQIRVNSSFYGDIHTDADMEEFSEQQAQAVKDTLAGVV